MEEHAAALRTPHGRQRGSVRSGQGCRKTDNKQNKSRKSPCVSHPVLGAAIVAALFATPALSAELTGTLKKIKDSGTITLGHRDASIPFSYLADNPNQPVGYSHDLQLKVVEAVKKELGMPDLKVRTTWSPRRPVSRWCRTAPWTSSAAPPPTTSNARSRSTSPRHLRSRHPPADQEDQRHQGLRRPGKNVVTTAGTTSERLLKAMNADKQMGMNIISAKDHGESFLMLESAAPWPS
jgi:glutamate/aspartate transport system substrate-binding protein